MLELEQKPNKPKLKFLMIKWINRFISRFPLISLNLIIIGMSGGILLGIAVITYTIYGVFLVLQYL